jgi:[acyl-carrier-protein] S-malonyltransferase
VGGDPDEVLTAIEAAGAYPANINGGGQVVAAGSPDALARLAQAPPTRARVIPLQVAGAFHTPYMDPALEDFGAAVEATDAAPRQVPWLSDLDGRAMPDDGAAVLERLVRQVVAPVRWDLVQQGFVELGVTGLIELAPAGVLTGLARRALPGVETLAVKTPDDLAAARELVARHADKESM